MFSWLPTRFFSNMCRVHSFLDLVQTDRLADVCSQLSLLLADVAIEDAAQNENDAFEAKVPCQHRRHQGLLR
jgi:hypothetical protein